MAYLRGFTLTYEGTNEHDEVVVSVGIKRWYLALLLVKAVATGQIRPRLTRAHHS